MLYCMDENIAGPSRKTIRVRKPSAKNSSKISFNYDDDFYVPISASDSLWNGIKFEPPKNENIEHRNSTTDEETEIKVIDLDSETGPPLLLLFPELKQEELNIQHLINQQVSTTEITKILVGKKPNFALLKSCKKLDNAQQGLSSLIETSESDDSMENKKIKNPNKTPLERYRKDSRDADDSDNGYNNLLNVNSQ